MTDAQAKYVKCRSRGRHRFNGGFVIDTNPPYYRCNDCGATYNDSGEASTPFGWRYGPGVEGAIDTALKANGVHVVPPDWYDEVPRDVA